MPQTSSNPSATQTNKRESLLVAYRHDAHKLTGHAHDSAPKTFETVRVNQQVPSGADADAAALSRPTGRPKQTVDAHQTHYRLSLLDGTSKKETAIEQPPSEAFNELLVDDDPEKLHRRWLASTVASQFNESVYYPYTSLKYHTLLVAALLDNYLSGSEFSDLSIVVDPPECVVPHRTLYAGDQCALRLTTESGSNPAAVLGSRPKQSWATVWSQLPANPLGTDHCRYDRFLDANLRRIGSWSTALQYLEAFTQRVR